MVVVYLSFVLKIIKAVNLEETGGGGPHSLCPALQYFVCSHSCIQTTRVHQHQRTSIFFIYQATSLLFIAID